MDGFERITGREHDGLVEKCQENGWLKVGGFDWQDDPFLEEYPYEFSRTDSVDRLREALGSGNWAIRQGFCYRDLAFIQQVNGGDEWWTLKRDGDAWTGFESWSFGAIAQEPERFERAMRDMCEATPEQCRSGEWAHLHEKAPEPLAQREGTLGAPRGNPRDHRRRARRAGRGRGRAAQVAAEGAPTYAKLSLEELSGLPEYATIKEIVSDRLRAASVEHHILPGEVDGRGHHVEVLRRHVGDLLHGGAAVEQLDRGAALGGGPVVEAEEVGGRRLRVEVDEQGPKAPGGEDRRQVHGGRRLADAALVVGNGYRAHGSRPL